VRPAPAWRRSASPGLLEGGGLLVRLYTCPERVYAGSCDTRETSSRIQRAHHHAVETWRSNEGSHCMNALSATLRALGRPGQAHGWYST
jgi:hypothetical protein